MKVNDYILLIEVSHAVQQELNRRSLEACDLTIQQAAALSRIESAGGRVTISQLAAGLSRASHSVSGMIASLENANLVVRQRAPTKDRRQVWVSLSSQGRRRLAAYKGAADSMVAPLTEGRISREEAGRLIAVLNSITDDRPSVR